MSLGPVEHFMVSLFKNRTQEVKRKTMKVI